MSWVNGYNVTGNWFLKSSSNTDLRCIPTTGISYLTKINVMSSVVLFADRHGMECYVVTSVIWMGVSSPVSGYIFIRDHQSLNFTKVISRWI